MKVSVIVPVYNCEKYLRQCMNSILKQTLKDIEIIAVDDGSEDESLSILKEYENADSRVKVIHQDNKTAGDARNEGLINACGDYLVFWDADDFFEADALRRMHDKAVKVDADVVIAPFNKYYGKLKKKWKRVPSSLREDYLPQEDPFNKDTVGDTLLQLTTVTPWNKMFKRSFVMENELRFQETKIVNDAYFVVMALHLATRITYIDYVVANYRVFIKDSLTSSFSNNPTLGTDVYIYIGEELRRRGVFNERAYHNRVVGYLVYIFRRLSSNDAFIRELEYVRAESKKLSLEKHDKDFYFVSWHKEFVDRLLLDDKEEFMSYFRAKIFDDFTKQECHRRVLESDLDSITKELKKKEEALNKVMNSRSYKIGQMITFVPRKIVSFIKGNKRKT